MTQLHTSKNSVCFPMSSPKECVLFQIVLICMFRKEHSFKHALKHVVPQKQFPGSLTKCILNVAPSLSDEGRKGHCGMVNLPWWLHLGHRLRGSPIKRLKAHGLVSIGLSNRPTPRRLIWVYIYIYIYIRYVYASSR